MRRIALLIFIFFIFDCYSQDLKSKLQGDWLCLGITNSKGDSISGKFGNSSEYLRFTFRRRNISFNESPIDESFEVPVKFKKDYFDLNFRQCYNIVSERRYYVVFIDENKMVLRTTGVNQDSIFYHFTNQDSFITNQLLNQDVTDIGYVIIKHLKRRKESKSPNRSSDYYVPNNERYLYPAPKFSSNSISAFGDYVSAKMQFPKGFELDSVSDELIVEFDIKDKRVCNINIVKGLDEHFDKSIIRIIKKTKRKWNPVEYMGEDIDSTLKIHFVFYLGRVKFANES